MSEESSIIARFSREAEHWRNVAQERLVMIDNLEAEIVGLAKARKELEQENERLHRHIDFIKRGGAE
jgi:septal ring factor EnvC (AmiA/AmiB activator)